MQQLHIATKPDATPAPKLTCQTASAAYLNHPPNHQKIVSGISQGLQGKSINSLGLSQSRQGQTRTGYLRRSITDIYEQSNLKNHSNQTALKYNLNVGTHEGIGVPHSTNFY